MDTKQSKRKAVERMAKAEEKSLEIANSEQLALAKMAREVAYMAILDDLDGLSLPEKRFLVAYMEHGNVSQACIDTKTPPSVHFEWMRDDDYKMAFLAAKRVADDRLETVARELATGAYSRPIVSLGKVVAYEPIFDTKLLLKLLEASNPERYGRKLDVTSNGHTLVKLVDKDAWESV